MKPPPITNTPPAFSSRRSDTGDLYTIYVHAPDGGPHPAVIVLDGDYFFDPAVAASRSLSEEGRAPAATVIGVGYGAGFGRPGNHRGRDYTTTPSKDEPRSGGAKAFLDYAAGELWPELAGRYDLRKDHRVLAGHSLGSLAVLRALFDDSPFFSRALASAPSIWWDDRSLLAWVSSLRDRNPDLPGKLYLGVGEEDTPSMLGDLSLLEAQLESRPFRGLEVTSQRFPGLDHYNVLATSLREGLASVLP
ncbi:MAG TPA: alpha/beta hydrolase-fold protein [Opitutaceae bacterium]